MRKLSLLALILLVFGLAMAGGCSKKVSSTPAGTTAAGSGAGAGAAPGGLTAEQLAEQQRQAIDKIGAEGIYFEFDKSDLSDTARQALTDKEIALAALDQALDEQWTALELASGTLIK